MTWPSSDITTTNTDNTGDSPQDARADLLALMVAFNLLRNHVPAFMQGLLDDVDAATARTTLGAAASGTNTDITSLGAVTGVTATAGDSSTKLATTAFVAGAGAKRGYLDGCIMSTAGSSATMSIGAGAAADSTNAVVMSLSATSKTTAAWSLGAGVGGLDTGSIANNTGYHWFVIRRPDTGVVDALFSLSATSPTLPTNYTQFRRIGWAKTNGSAQWTSFRQVGDLFLWDTPVFDVGANNPGTSAVSRTLSVPVGYFVEAIVNAGLYNSGSGVAAGLLLSSLLQADVAPSETTTPLWTSGALTGNATGGARSSHTQQRIMTNSAAAIRSRLSASDASVTMYLATVGWVDPRGKDA